MSGSLFIKNQQRTFPINVRYLRWLTRELLQELLWIDAFDLAIYLVRAPRMAELNCQYLRHEGPTDVITLDYAAGNPRGPGLTPEIQPVIHGEIFVCLDIAREQARQFRTTWQSEVVRYVIHGILHLHGHDDLKPAARKKMKREENRLLKQIAQQYPLRKLGNKASV